MGGVDFDMFVMLPGNMVLDSQALLQAVEVCKLFTRYSGCILVSRERRRNARDTYSFNCPVFLP